MIDKKISLKKSRHMIDKCKCYKAIGQSFMFIISLDLNQNANKAQHIMRQELADEQTSDMFHRQLAFSDPDIQCF